MKTAKYSQSFECAREVLTLANGTSILYKLPKDSFEFFVNRYLPCLLGSSVNGKAASWGTAGPEDQRKLLAFLSRVEKLGGLCGTFDDIPAIRDDSEYFLLYYVVLGLKKEEKQAKVINQSRKIRLEKIDSLLAEFPERIFKGFSKDKDPSRERGRKPPRPSPLDYARLEQMLVDYFSREQPPQPPPPPEEKSGNAVLGCFILLLIAAVIGVLLYFLGSWGWGLLRNSDSDSPPPEDPPIEQPVQPVVQPDTISVYQGNISQFYVGSADFQVIEGLKLDHIHESSDSNARFAVFKLNGSTTKVLDIGDSFKFRDMELRLVGIDSDKKPQAGIAYIELGGRPGRIACLPNQPVSLLRKAVLCNEQNGTTISALPGSVFKLADSESGEVEYRIVSVNPVTSQIVVESNSDNHEKFTLVPKTPAGKGVNPEGTGTPRTEQQAAPDKDSGNGKAKTGAEAIGQAIRQSAEEAHREEQRNKNKRAAAGGRQETAQTEPRQEAGNSSPTNQDQRELIETGFLLGLKEILDRESKIAIEEIEIDPDRISTSGSTVVVPFIDSKARPEERRIKLRNDSFTPDVSKLFSALNCKAMKQAVIGGEKTRIIDSANDDYRTIDSIFVDRNQTNKLAETLEKIKNGQYTVCRFVVSVIVKSYDEQHSFKSFSGDAMNFTVRSEMKADVEIYDRSTGDAYATELLIKAGERSYNISTEIKYYSDFVREKDWSSEEHINRGVILEDIGRAIHNYLTDKLLEKESAPAQQTESAQGTEPRTTKQLDPETKQKQDTLRREFVQSLSKEMEKQARVAMNDIRLAGKTIPATGYALTMSDQRSGLRQDVKTVSFTPAIPGFTSVQDDPGTDQGGDPCTVIRLAAIDRPGTGAKGSNRSTATPRVMDPADDDFDKLSEVYDDEEAVDSLYSTRKKIESGQFTICRYEVAVTVKSYEETHVFKEFSVGKMIFSVRSRITLDLEVNDRSGHRRYLIEDLKLSSEEKTCSIGTQRSLTDFTSTGGISTGNAEIDRKQIFEDFGKKLNNYLKSGTFTQALHP